jgi:uncharacterized protein YdeI (YjbR/CyaY-like superfamily)
LSFGLNTALLTATNYIQLPKIFSSSLKLKNILNNVVRNAEGEYVSLAKRIWGKECIKLKMLLLFLTLQKVLKKEHSLLFKQVLNIILIKKYRNETLLL